ncbi:hypothetical protein K7432_014209 [Basidiobolus ranarum]|uniref:Uncharacterized protein n=1 Tax=Basidiobolus ranarum TaxID=34480 RepID=A0ABR2WHY8_9FUNG
MKLFFPLTLLALSATPVLSECTDGETKCSQDITISVLRCAQGAWEPRILCASSSVCETSEEGVSSCEIVDEEVNPDIDVDWDSNEYPDPDIYEEVDDYESFSRDWDSEIYGETDIEVYPPNNYEYKPDDWSEVGTSVEYGPDGWSEEESRDVADTGHEYEIVDLVPESKPSSDDEAPDYDVGVLESDETDDAVGVPESDEISDPYEKEDRR